MQRVSILFLVSAVGLCYAQSLELSGPKGTATQPAARPNQGALSLGVLLEAEERSHRGTVRVVVLRDGRPLRTTFGSLGQLAVVRDLPPGPVEVVVFSSFPATGTVGYFGRGTLTLEEKGTNALKVNCEKRESTSFHLTVKDKGGGAVARKVVDIRDMADSEWAEFREANTDEEGSVTFVGFPGRTYQARIVEEVGTSSPYHYSQPLVVRDEDNAFAWRLTAKKRLDITLWTEIDGQRKPLDRPYLPIRAGGWSMRPIKNSQYVICKELLPPGVREVRIEPDGVQGYEGLCVTQNGVIKVDESEVQSVDVVFGRKKNADVVIECPQAKDATKRAVATAVYLCEGDKVVTHCGLNHSFAVPPGKYTLHTWLPGWKLGSKEIELKDGKNKVQVDLTKAAVIKGVVLNEKGAPVEGAVVGVMYPSYHYRYHMPASSTRTTPGGEFTIPSDELEGGLVIAVKPDMAISYVSVSTVAKDGKIVLVAGAKVSRTVKTSGIPDAKAGRYVWRRKECLWIDYATVTPSKDGKVEAVLSPGEYSEFFVLDRQYVHVQDTAIKGSDEGKTAVSITAKDWEGRGNLVDLK